MFYFPPTFLVLCISLPYLKSTCLDSVCTRYQILKYIKFILEQNFERTSIAFRLNCQGKTMVVLSKLSKISSYSYHGVTVSQAACTAGIVFYLGGVLYPRWVKSKNADITKNNIGPRKSSPSVNGDFFIQLKKLLKVNV